MHADSCAMQHGCTALRLCLASACLFVGWLVCFCAFPLLQQVNVEWCLSTFSGSCCSRQHTPLHGVCCLLVPREDRVWGLSHSLWRRQLANWLSTAQRDAVVHALLFVGCPRCVIVCCVMHTQAPSALCGPNQMYEVFSRLDC